MPPVQLVCFDAAGTLLETAGPVAETYAEFGRAFGCELDHQTIKARFYSAFSRYFRSETKTDEAHERDCWRKVVAEVFGPASNNGALFDALYSYYAEPESWRLRPAALSWLRAYQDDRVRIAVASNFDTRLFGILAVLLPEIPRQHIHISAHLGFRKPAPEFFQKIESLHGVGSDVCLLVGDEDEADRMGAQQAGWKFRQAPR